MLMLNEESKGVNFSISHSIELDKNEFDKVVTGEKIQETMFKHLDVQVGDIIEINSFDNDDVECVEYVVVSGLDCKKVKDLTRLDAISEGYNDTDEYYQSLNKKYGALDNNQSVNMIIFTHVNK